LKQSFLTPHNRSIQKIEIMDGIEQKID